MDHLNQVYEMLDKELEDITKRGELTNSSLSAIEKITHSMKSLACVMDAGYSSGYSRRYPDRSMNYSRGRDDGYSRNYSRDYSGDTLRSHLEHAMMDARDERTREDIRKLMDRV